MDIATIVSLISLVIVIIGGVGGYFLFKGKVDADLMTINNTLKEIKSSIDENRKADEAVRLRVEGIDQRLQAVEAYKNDSEPSRVQAIKELGIVIAGQEELKKMISDLSVQFGDRIKRIEDKIYN